MAGKLFLKELREFRDPGADLEYADIIIDDLLRKQGGYVFKDLGAHVFYKIVFGEIGSFADYPVKESVGVFDSLCGINLLNMYTEKTEGPDMNIYTFFGVFHLDGILGSPLKIIKICCIDEIYRTVERGFSACQGVCYIPERGKSAVTGLESDVARADENGYLALTASVGFKGIAGCQVIAKYGDL